MPKRDFSSLAGHILILRKDFGPKFKATIGMMSDNEQYVSLLLENGTTVWEAVDKLILEEDFENKKKTDL
jgi:hypothetical protein